MIFGRRSKLPTQLRPGLRPGEQVVAWARATERAVVVATNHGLFLPGRGARMGWHEIYKATWSGRQLTITPAEVLEQRDGYLVVSDGPSTTVALPEPGNVPQVVRTRVTSSVSVTSHHPLPSGGVRVVARRVPGADGLAWAARYDEGTDPRGPGIPEATAELVASYATAATDPSI